MHFFSIFTHAIISVTHTLRELLFFDVYGFPFLILWLFAGSIFFTLRLKFISVRLFGHAIDVVRGKFSLPNEPGEVSHFQALVAAVSGTVGVGNIAGVAVAIAMGGPGSLFWMIICGLLGMATKFAEVTLGHKYRQKDKNGKLLGGPFYYLQEGLKEMGFPRIGKMLAILFSVCCIGATIGGVNMLQANQTVVLLAHSFSFLENKHIWIALCLAICNGVVLIGGVKRLVQVAEMIVPVMTLVFLASTLVIIFSHISYLVEALSIILHDAFTGEAMGGGVIGALVAGIRRAAYSSESGLGSSPIIHATAQTHESVREGCVALLETFLSTTIICLLSGLTIVITQIYGDTTILPGILLSQGAFATISPWFPLVLSFCVTLFAYSTMMTWSYYGERSWAYLFGTRYLKIYYSIFCLTTFLGGISNFGILIDFSDMLMYSMALPNMIGLYVLHNVVAKDTYIYMVALKKGVFKQYKECK